MEILIENQAVKTEFDRWCEYFGDHDPYTANGNIGIRDVLRSHFLIADYFYGEGYGMGEITSGSFSPTLGLSIALARVPASVPTGARAQVDIRGKMANARVVKYPFVRHGKSCLS